MSENKCPVCSHPDHINNRCQYGGLCSCMLAAGPHPALSPLPESLFCDQCGTMTVNTKTRVMPCEKHKANAAHRALIEEQSKALALVDEVWTRSNLYPEVNFLGDDEHEAWGKVKEALAHSRRGLGEKDRETQ